MNEPLVISTPEGIAAFAALQAYYALRIEVTTGLRHSQGSVMNLIKERYLPECTKRTKKGVLEEFRVYLTEAGILREER